MFKSQSQCRKKKLKSLSLMQLHLRHNNVIDCKNFYDNRSLNSEQSRNEKFIVAEYFRILFFPLVTVRMGFQQVQIQYNVLYQGSEVSDNY